MSHNPKNGHDRTGFYSRYNPGPVNELHSWPPSKTDQRYRVEADINNLMARYAQDGLRPPMVPPTFRDVSHMDGDYHHAMNVVTRAGELFAASPVAIRDRFQTPGALLAFLGDAANRDEAERLGLIQKRTTGPAGASTGTPQGAPPPAPPKTDN